MNMSKVLLLRDDSVALKLVVLWPTLNAEKNGLDDAMDRIVSYLNVDRRVVAKKLEMLIGAGILNHNGTVDEVAERYALTVAQHEVQALLPKE